MNQYNHDWIEHYIGKKFNLTQDDYDTLNERFNNHRCVLDRVVAENTAMKNEVERAYKYAEKTDALLRESLNKNIDVDLKRIAELSHCVERLRRSQEIVVDRAMEFIADVMNESLGSHRHPGDCPCSVCRPSYGLRKELEKRVYDIMNGRDTGFDKKSLTAVYKSV